MQDKKKMLIIAALAVIMIAVGVFQFSGSGSAPAPAKDDKPKTDRRHSSMAPGTEVAMGEKPGANPANPSAGTAAKPDPGAAALPELSERDPFDGHDWQPALDTKKPAQPTVPQPRPIGGSKLPPMSVANVGVLPNAGPGGPSGPIGPGSMPEMPKADPNAFTYSVSGVVLGDRPMAVLVDDKGNQQLVTVGNSFNGGDSQLIGVARGKVTVRHHGKTLTMSVGANPK